jgi:4-amino-4-deoxy-L-arabinose transferase-like glycosyltransferase
MLARSAYRAPLPKALVAAAAAAFAVRIAVILVTKSYLFPPPAPITNPIKEHWDFGLEIGRVARSIVMGHGFGSPFHGWTGPTAWYAPVYPYLLAGVFKIFGVYTNASAIVILSLNSLFAALTCIPIFFVAEEEAGRRTALWSAWLWALTPMFFRFATHWAWETSLAALLTTSAVWVSLRLCDDAGWEDWFAAGMLWGLIALTSTSMVAVMPFALGWSWLRSRYRAHTKGIVLAFLAMFLTVLPWIVRNHAEFGRWFFVRDNFWAEMHFGNAESARGIWMGWTHPELNDTELQLYNDLGELRYIDEKKTEVQAFLRRRPAFFADLCVRRVFLFWCNLPKTWADDLSPHDVLRDQWWIICFSALAWVGLFMLLRDRRGYGWIFAPLMVVYPMVFYLTSVYDRYRHPMEPIMVILAVYAVASTWKPATVQH